MTNDPDNLPDHLTFSQRYGFEPLPEPMRLEELSDDLRRETWNAVRELLLKKSNEFRLNVYSFHGESTKFVERIVGSIGKIPEDEVPTQHDDIMSALKHGCLHITFHTVLNLIETILNDRDVDDGFAGKISHLFEKHGAAYWLDTSRRPYRFVPRVSKEHGEATQQAVQTVEQSGMAAGASTHLRQAV